MAPQQCQIQHFAIEIGLGSPLALLPRPTLNNIAIERMRELTVQDRK